MFETNLISMPVEINFKKEINEEEKLDFKKNKRFLEEFGDE